MKDGSEVNNRKDIENFFNYFFTYVGHNLATSVAIAVLFHTIDIQKSSDLLDFHFIVDDSTLFYSARCLSELESTITCQLLHAHKWLCANKLSLNIEKSSFIIFHPTQKKLDRNVHIFLNDYQLRKNISLFDIWNCCLGK